MIFPDNIVVLSSGVEKSKFCLTFWSRLRCLDKSETKYQITRRRIPEKGKLHRHRRENTKTGKMDFVLVDCD